MCTFSKFWFHFSSQLFPFGLPSCGRVEKKQATLSALEEGKKSQRASLPSHKQQAKRGKKKLTSILFHAITKKGGIKRKKRQKKSKERKNAMDGSGAYYASRTELLEWLNSVLPESAASQLQLKKVENCKSGIPYAILLAEIYPHLRGALSKRLKGASVGIVSMIATGNPHDANFGHQQQNVSEYDCQHNMKMIQDVLNKNHISRLVEVDKIAKGHFPSNLEFLQWFRKFSSDFGVQAQPALYTDVDVVAERGGDPYPRSAQHDNASVHSSHLNAATTSANGAGGVGPRAGVGGDSTSRSIGATSTTSSANNTTTNLSTASSGPKFVLNIGGLSVGASRGGGGAAVVRPQTAVAAERRPLRSTSGSRLASAAGTGGGASSPSSQSQQSSVATRRNVSPRGAAADRSFNRTASAQTKESVLVNTITTDRNLLLDGGGPQRSSSAKRSLLGEGGLAVSLVNKREERTGFRQAPPTPTPSSSVSLPRAAGTPNGVGSSSPSAFSRSQYPALSGSPQSIPSPSSSKNINRTPNGGGAENEYNNNGQEYSYDDEERLLQENEAPSPDTSPRSGRGVGNTSSRTSALTSADLRSFRARISSIGGGVGGSGGQTKEGGGGGAQVSVSLKNAVPIYGNSSRNNNNTTKDTKGGLVENGRLVGGNDEAAVVGELNYSSLSAETQEHLLGQLNAKLFEAESDRDFFYDKLRMIETLINKQRPTTRGRGGAAGTIDNDAESILLIETIRKILVSENNEIALQ